MTFALQLWAFLRRDVALELSYRFSLVLHLFGVLAHLLTFYYVARLVEAGAHPALARYEGGYFAFVLVGIALSSFLGFGLSGFASALRLEQYYGTLESLLASPTPAWRVATLATLSGYLTTSIEALLYLLAGALLLGVDFSAAAWGTASLVLFLSVSAFSALGILAGSFILVFKRGDPINWLMGTLSQLVGGVYFPVTILPDWLRPLSIALPITHGLEGMRRALLEGAGAAEIAGSLKALAAFSVVGWPLAILALNAALTRARRMASLGHY